MMASLSFFLGVSSVLPNINTRKGMRLSINVIIYSKILLPGFFERGIEYVTTVITKGNIQMCAALFNRLAK
jgi:hypothetical protein